MGVEAFRTILIVTACVMGLTGCVTASKDQQTPQDELTGAPPETTGAVTTPEKSGAAPEVLGSDPHDDLSLAKKYFRQGGFGLAEQHFRKAAEMNPGDAEAWVGLAASYDRLKRFELADRAYRQAIRLVGRTPEILNNQGYSYMLRGDYRRARATLLAARAKDPASPYIKTNLDLLNQTLRDAKGIN